jgi:predicted O-methyltransferase YrrM
MGVRELGWLADRGAEAHRIVEVGTWMGRSTVALLSRCPDGALYAVDTWAGTPGDVEQAKLYPDPEAAYRTFLAYLGDQIDAGQVRVMRMDSREAAAVLLAECGADFDLVFIDADHSYEGCRGDIGAYLPLVKPGGIISGHDFHWPGVERAARELLAPVQRGPDSIWWARR